MGPGDGVDLLQFVSMNAQVGSSMCSSCLILFPDGSLSSTVVPESFISNIFDRAS